MADAAMAVRGFFAGSWQRGDVALTNDPFGGGTVVTEFTIVSDAVVVRVRLPDVGGFHMGGLAPEAFDVWGEGARFTPLRVATAGAPRREALDLITLNSRTPRLVRGALDAILQVCAGPPEESVNGGQLSPGEYNAEVAIEAPLAVAPVVRVKMTVGEQIEIDLSGSDPQVPAPLNSTASHTRDCCLAALVDAGLRPDQAFRSMRVVAGEATVTGATLPAATGLSPYFTARAIRAGVLMALGQEEQWWEREGQHRFLQRVDPDTLLLRESLAAAYARLETAP
jgi:N-methylhydantoinase B/oxoprolinase/acetone carboxylase alpha subunit